MIAITRITLDGDNEYLIQEETVENNTQALARVARLLALAEEDPDTYVQLSLHLNEHMCPVPGEP